MQHDPRMKANKRRDQISSLEIKRMQVIDSVWFALDCSVIQEQKDGMNVEGNSSQVFCRKTSTT